MPWQQCFPKLWRLLTGVFFCVFITIFGALESVFADFVDDAANATVSAGDLSLNIKGDEEVYGERAGRFEIQFIERQTSQLTGHKVVIEVIGENVRGSDFYQTVPQQGQERPVEGVLGVFLVPIADEQNVSVVLGIHMKSIACDKGGAKLKDLIIKATLTSDAKPEVIKPAQKKVRVHCDQSLTAEVSSSVEKPNTHSIVTFTVMLHNEGEQKQDVIFDLLGLGDAYEQVAVSGADCTPATPNNPSVTCRAADDKPLVLAPSQSHRVIYRAKYIRSTDCSDHTVSVKVRNVETAGEATSRGIIQNPKCATESEPWTIDLTTRGPSIIEEDEKVSLLSGFVTKDRSEQSVNISLHVDDAFLLLHDPEKITLNYLHKLGQVCKQKANTPEFVCGSIIVKAGSDLDIDFLFSDIKKACDEKIEKITMSVYATFEDGTVIKSPALVLPLSCQTIVAIKEWSHMSFDGTTKSDTHASKPFLTKTGDDVLWLKLEASKGYNIAGNTRFFAEVSNGFTVFTNTDWSNGIECSGANSKKSCTFRPFYSFLGAGGHAIVLQRNRDFEPECGKQYMLTLTPESNTDTAVTFPFFVSCDFACSDGKDNDGDGKIDSADLDCMLGGRHIPTKNSEKGPICRPLFDEDEFVQADTLNYVFVADKKNTDAKSIAQQWVSLAKEYAPFGTNWHKFQFFIASPEADMPQSSARCDCRVPISCTGVKLHQAVYICPNHCRANVALELEATALPLQAVAKAFVHEFGHTFGLADEYSEKGKISKPGLNNCADTVADAKKIWADAVTINNENCPDTLLEPGQSDEKTLCKIGCSYTSDNVRWLENTVMNDHILESARAPDGFGPVNEYFIEKVLENYSGKNGPGASLLGMMTSWNMLAQLFAGEPEYEPAIRLRMVRNANGGYAIADSQLIRVLYGVKPSLQIGHQVTVNVGGKDFVQTFSGTSDTIVEDFDEEGIHLVEYISEPLPEVFVEVGLGSTQVDPEAMQEPEMAYELPSGHAQPSGPQQRVMYSVPDIPLINGSKVTPRIVATSCDTIDGDIKDDCPKPTYRGQQVGGALQSAGTETAMHYWLVIGLFIVAAVPVAFCVRKNNAA